MTAWLLAVLALPVGYLLGSTHPWGRLGRWADWQLRADGRWWLATTPRQTVVATVFTATHPRMAWNAWRHRDDPLPVPAPAPQRDPDWATNRRAERRRES